jgi:hypothetical protein
MAQLKKLATGFNLPWFIWDLRNFQLITTKNIPGDVSDNKNIVLSETPIPGLNFDPVQHGGNSNRKISFTLPLIRRNNTVGNILMLAQFRALRNTPKSLQEVFKRGNSQFGGANKVLYYWGAGDSSPLEYFVSKCDFVHKSSFTNRFGFTQYSEVSMELILDETSQTFEVEDTFRRLAVFAGGVQGSFDISRDLLNKGSE